MCIEKNLALYAKSPKGYARHLEEILLDQGDYRRCQMCKRVDHEDLMIEVNDGEFCCDGRCEKRHSELKDFRESDERDYNWLKYGV